MECSRCGRCCIEFEGQIRFSPNEPLIQAIDSLCKSTPNPVLSVYQTVMAQYAGKFSRLVYNNKNLAQLEKKTVTVKGSLNDFSVLRISNEDPDAPFWYFLPSKRMLWCEFPELASQVLPSTTQTSQECIFLTWVNEASAEQKIPICTIHGTHPQMCDAYPQSKGWVCRNHPERKYTRVFFEYQRSKIGFAINALKMIYESKVMPDQGFDLLTLMMDFGTFQLPQLEHFFISEFQLDHPTWSAILTNLLALELISIHGSQIQGISFNEVELKIDHIMHSNNWT